MRAEIIPEKNNQDPRRLYAVTLLGLKEYLSRLGLEKDSPTEQVQIIPGTEGPGRPLGALLPAYLEIGKGDIKKMEKILFNLYSLTGFKPPIIQSSR